MNVIVRPQFYLDIEEEVHWLFQNAGGEIAQRPQATGHSFMANKRFPALAGFLFGGQKTGTLPGSFRFYGLDEIGNAELTSPMNLNRCHPPPQSLIDLLFIQPRSFN